jgi:hypothetical protein
LINCNKKAHLSYFLLGWLLLSRLRKVGDIHDNLRAETPDCFARPFQGNPKVFFCNLVGEIYYKYSVLNVAKQLFCRDSRFLK